ncbi:MAG TPA: efflux RND transporter permease subunit, partial [Planctomycetota bacterium]|nr:efflux RND transporter permease subunit [Planctomycetota bacterium]
YGMVQRESNANVVSTCRSMRDLLKEFQTDPQLAGRVQVETLFDQGEMIEASLTRLRETAIWGGVLAAIVLLAFLRRLRTTLCVALSIPISILLALVYEYFSGGSFNILTMTGLTLALGMLVDNSVVVIENIARLRAQGVSRLEAAATGARDVGLAITLATITTLVVFVPLVFTIEDPMMRAFLAAMTRPLSLALLFSLVVALFFLPVLAMLVDHERPRWMRKPVAVLGWLASIPARLLAYALGALRFVGRLILVCLNATTYGVGRVFSPLRYGLVLGWLALCVWGWSRNKATFEWNDQLRAMGLATPKPGPTWIWWVVGVGGGLLLFFGPSAWRRHGHRLAPSGPLIPSGHSVLEWVQSGNHRLLEWTMAHRLMAVVLSVVCLATVAIPMSGMKLVSFGQDEDLSELSIRVELEPNFTLAQASREVERYEDYFAGRKAELGFRHVSARFRATQGEVGLHFEAGSKTRDQIEALRLQLQREMPRYAGHALYFGGEQEMGDANNQQVQFELRGSNSEELERLGAQAVAILKGVSGLTDVESPLEQSPEQVRLILDREAGFDFGVTSQSTLSNVSWALRGAALARFQEEGRETPMYIEYDQEKLAGLDTLRNLNIWTGTGPVALASYGEVEFRPGNREIWRWNGQTTFSINARLTDPNRKVEVQQAGYDALESLELPRGYSLGRDTSAFAKRDQEMGQMKYALYLSLALILIVMGILFESLLLPFAIMTTIPFAVLGALWTLYFLHPSMDSMGWIGFILLVGVVVNNGIVLLDKIHRLHTEDGLTRLDAILEGTRARVRPILMTAMTTVFGLLPITLSPYDGKGIDYRALATCVAGGLAISTFFTLWVVPLAYSLMDDLSKACRRTFAQAMGRTSPPATMPSSPGAVTAKPVPMQPE